MEAIGEEIRTVQFGWPLGMPLVRKVDMDLWEVRVRFALKRRNPHVGCVRIAQQIARTFGVEIDKDSRSARARQTLPARRLRHHRPVLADLPRPSEG
jgi:hypothetical protein